MPKANRNTHKAAATSFDVARRAGVSRAMVSRAFTPGASISEKARKRVIKAASELDYRVNHVARALNKQRTDLVGMIASGMNTPFRAKQIDALAKMLVAEGFRPMLFCIDECHGVEQLISMLLNYSASGVIVTSDRPPSDICQQCSDLNVPLVVIDRGDHYPLVDQVTGDNIGGGELAAAALIEAGRTSLYVVRPDDTVYSLLTRVDAFLDHATRAGHPPEIIPTSDYSYSAGKVAAERLAETRLAGCGVFCPNDEIALGFVDTMRGTFGVRIPEDMSVIGYDNIPQCEWEFAKLTTIEQPVDEFARVTVELMKRRIENPSSPEQRRVLPVTLVRRDTV